MHLVSYENDVSGLYVKNVCRLHCYFSHILFTTYHMHCKLLLFRMFQTIFIVVTFAELSISYVLFRSQIKLLFVCITENNLFSYIQKCEIIKLFKLC